MFVLYETYITFNMDGWEFGIQSKIYEILCLVSSSRLEQVF